MFHLNHWKRAAAVCLVALALVSVSVVRRGSAQASGYILIDLGTLGGGTESKAFAINSSGGIAGVSTATTGGQYSPASWTGGGVTDIGGFAADVGGEAYALNEIGYVAGFGRTSTGELHPFIWSDIFHKRDLGTLGGYFAAAFDVNNANQVVGQSEIAQLVDRGFVWSAATGMQAIPTLGGSSSGARSINDRGEIVGAADRADGRSHAFLLRNGAMIDLGTLGGHRSVAYKINERGVVVGSSTTTNGVPSPPNRAFLYTSEGGMISLGTLGGPNSVAYDVNDGGFVVGAAEIAFGQSRAFIYSPTQGMQNLNDLAAGAGWTLLEARSINDRGEIVGFGINPSGQMRAFLLKPDADEVPGGEPPPCASLDSSPATAARPVIIIPGETQTRQTSTRRARDRRGTTRQNEDSLPTLRSMFARGVATR